MMRTVFLVFFVSPPLVLLYPLPELLNPKSDHSMLLQNTPQWCFTAHRIKVQYLAGYPRSFTVRRLVYLLALSLPPPFLHPLCCLGGRLCTFMLLSLCVLFPLPWTSLPPLPWPNFPVSWALKPTEFIVTSPAVVPQHRHSLSALCITLGFVYVAFPKELCTDLGDNNSHICICHTAGMG